MKKIILFAAILFAGVSVVKAEGGTTTTENKQSTLTVKLKPYQIINVTGNAEIVFDSKEDYTALEKEQTASSNVNVGVSSAGGFTVSVYAANLVLSTDANKEIEATNIKVLATATTNSLANTITTDVVLGNSASPLIESASGQIDTSYDLVFKAIDGDVYRQAFDGNVTTNTDEQVYTTTVYYTIAAK